MSNFNTLVLNAQQGDETSLEIIVKYMQNKIYLQLQKNWKEIQGGHEVIDMVQFALIGVLRGVRTFVNKPGFSAFKWLWRNARNEINLESRYLLYNKRKININKISLDQPVTESGIALGEILQGRSETESRALSNVAHDSFLYELNGQLSKFEKPILAYMMLDLPNKQIAEKLQITAKAVDNAKQRIKVKALKVLNN